MSKKDNADKTPPELPHKKDPSVEDSPKVILSLSGPPSIAKIIDCLLKSPDTILAELEKGNLKTVGARLAVTAILCLAIFGLILGLFSGGDQMWSAPVKVVAGLILSGLITLPSLYIFSCLNGLEVSLKSVAGLLLSCLTLTGLLLLGFAPVSWIFSQSTHSDGFMGFLTLAFWLIALGFGLTLMFRTAKAKGAAKMNHLKIWAFIFVLVTLQMSTSLRPIIGESEDTFLPTEKKFFLQHWTQNWFDRY